MSATAVPAGPHGLARMLGWGRLRFTLVISVVLGMMIGGGTNSGSMFVRTVLLGLSAMVMFGLFEQWPRRLPRWLARWVLQVLGVALAMPLGTMLIHLFAAAAGAQVAPHFLFDTLANVQALVDAGSPRASAALRCPAMTLLTLVENAVRHGIDPSEEGGRIDIHARRRGDRCVLSLSDTGAGLRPTGGGLGTGLSTLRERLELVFDGDVRLHVTAQHPRGASAELDFPARGAAG